MDSLDSILSHLSIPLSFTRPLSSFSSAPPSNAPAASGKEEEDHEQVNDELEKRKKWRDESLKWWVELKTTLERTDVKNVHVPQAPQSDGSVPSIAEQVDIIGRVARFVGDWDIETSTNLSDPTASGSGSTTTFRSNSDKAHPPPRPAKAQTQAIATVVEDAWTDERIKKMANDILSLLCPTSTSPHQLLQSLLTTTIKPFFQSSPHPHISPTTGRKVTHPATQDVYESQKWKTHSPGMGNLVLWCVEHISSESYPSLWHLVVPPMMTLLDDYEVRYKIQGVRIVYAFLLNAPRELLKRTGIDELIYTSLTTCLAHLNHASTPALLNLTFPTLLLHIAKTASATEDRFDKLSYILGEGIISGIWMYAEEDMDVMLVSLEWLKEVVSALGVGSVRYIKAMITQLVHILYPPTAKGVEPLQLVALENLTVIIQIGHERIGESKMGSEGILDAVCRCWVVHVCDGGQSREGELAMMLKHTCDVLVSACPSVRNQVERVVRADETLLELCQ